MMTIFEESKIRFEFDANYQLIKSDNQVNIENVKKHLQGTKDIDFFGFYGQNQTIFIEIKNFRGSLVEEVDVLCTEVAQKLRDTVAMIAGASRNTTNDAEFWEKLHQYIGDSNKEIICIFWLEEDLPNTTRNLNRMKIIADNLKKKSKWLTTKISVQSVQQKSLAGIKATFLPA